MTDTQITAQQKFEQTIFERLREDIGKLLPDEVLAEMTKHAMEKMFFEKRRVDENTNRQWGSPHYVDRPSWFETYVEERLRAKANELADKWIADNSEALAKRFEAVLVAQAPAILAQAIFRPIETAINASEQRMGGLMQEYFKRELGMLPR